MIGKKKAIGISLAITFAVSAVMLVKTLLFSPGQEVKIKTAQKREEPNEQNFKAVEKEKQQEEKLIEQEQLREIEKNPEPEEVNINTADKAMLEGLPGIGPALADAIISHREEKGYFEHKEEIMEVSGIGKAKYKQISQLISIGD